MAKKYYGTSARCEGCPCFTPVRYTDDTTPYTLWECCDPDTGMPKTSCIHDNVEEDQWEEEEEQ